jgi:hypothetical protein
MTDIVERLRAYKAEAEVVIARMRTERTEHAEILQAHTALIIRLHEVTTMLEAERARRRWLPIDSAPKDGRFVSLWRANRQPFSGRYEDGEWLDAMNLCREPSHWQPLPEPPSADALVVLP